MSNEYLQETAILNFNHPRIQQLVAERSWRQLDKVEATKAIHNFVRDEIKFGYNADDQLPASTVLVDGYGQCNTKGNLLMALLRVVGVKTRFHGFTIYNELQRGAVPNYIMPLAPKRIVHSWIEAELNGKWYKLEGFIIDSEFLTQVQRAFPNTNVFSGYGISVACLQKPKNEFDLTDTYIQSEGIADDFGVFDSPDAFYQQHGTNMRGLKKLAYRYGLRHMINHHVRKVRRNGIVN